jgi:hypothetical protein
MTHLPNVGDRVKVITCGGDHEEIGYLLKVYDRGCGDDKCKGRLVTVVITEGRSVELSGKGYERNVCSSSISPNPY